MSAGSFAFATLIVLACFGAGVLVGRREAIAMQRRAAICVADDLLRRFRLLARNDAETLREIEKMEALVRRQIAG